MAKEIERKYLVIGEYKHYAFDSYLIRQGFISSEKESVVRIRITDNKAFITIKGKTTGITRYEWEKEILMEEAEELLLLCKNDIIKKKRHLVKHGNYTIEVDEFYGRNKGLTIAEIELRSDEEDPDLPDWIGDDVSQDYRYQNSNLSLHPYEEWDNK